MWIRSPEWKRIGSATRFERFVVSYRKTILPEFHSVVLDLKVKHSSRKFESDKKYTQTFILSESASQISRTIYTYPLNLVFILFLFVEGCVH